MTCKCGFKFSGPGEFRNCEAFVTKTGDSGVVCPKCKTAYVKGQEVTLVDPVHSKTRGKGRKK